MLIRGENYNALFHLFRFYDSLRRHHEQHTGSERGTSPWFGGTDLRLSYLLADIRRLATEMLIGSFEGREVLCTGFKEIRYLESEKHFDDYIAFLAQLFPNALFIVNRRDHKEVVQSAFWRQFTPESALDELRRTDELFDRLPLLHSAVFDMNYKDLSLKSGRVRELFQRIGAPYSEDKVAAVLAQPHSYRIAPEKRNAIRLGLFDGG